MPNKITIMKSKMILSLLLLCSSLTSQETPVKETQKPQAPVETKEQAIARVTKELKTLPKLVNIRYDEFEDTSTIRVIAYPKYLESDFDFWLNANTATGKVIVSMAVTTAAKSWLFMDSVKFLDRNTRKTHTAHLPRVRRNVWSTGTCYEATVIGLDAKTFEKFDDWSKLAVRVYGERGHREAHPNFTSKSLKSFKKAIRILNEAYSLKIDPVDVVPTLGKEFRLKKG